MARPIIWTGPARAARIPGPIERGSAGRVLAEPGSGWSEFVGPAVGSGDVDLTGSRVEAHGPPSFMDPGVMPPTRQDHVIDRGLSIMEPRRLMVGVAPVKRNIGRCHVPTGQSCECSGTGLDLDATTGATARRATGRPRRSRRPNGRHRRARSRQASMVYHLRIRPLQTAARTWRISGRCRGAPLNMR